MNFVYCYLYTEEVEGNAFCPYWWNITLSREPYNGFVHLTKYSRIRKYLPHKILELNICLYSEYYSQDGENYLLLYAVTMRHPSISKSWY
jgi:hypothetical protein